jgi:hypothetical protein
MTIGQINLWRYAVRCAMMEANPKLYSWVNKDRPYALAR